MRNILTLLMASFILFAFSFTFSSCKDCGKKEPKPTGRGGKTSTEGNSKTKSGDDKKTSDNQTSTSDTLKPKKKLRLSDIELLVKKAAKYTYVAHNAAAAAYDELQMEGDSLDFVQKKLQELVIEKGKLGDLMRKMAEVEVEAERPEDKAIAAENLKAIELLWLKMKLEEKAAELWVARAEEERLEAEVKDADKANAEVEAKVKKAQTKEQSASDARNKISDEWMAMSNANSNALNIAEEVFIEVAMVEGGANETRALARGAFYN
jgi:hypothetical protein